MAEVTAPIDSGIASEEIKVTAGKKRAAVLSDLPDKVHTWPYLVRAEFIAGCVLILFLMIWSITIDAPMEEPANPTKTPNPSKAPWYFLGLQEMLVYFDPWFAGVIAPTLIIVGLMVIPYIDINPNGNGYYTFKERKFAISNFLFGFIGLWCAQIYLGVFHRGPGWNFFPLGAYWDPHKVAAMTNVDLPYLLGARTETSQMLVGLALIGAYFSILPIFGFLMRNKPWMKQLGIVRYYIVAGLFVTQLGIVMKMILRWTLAVKYILVIPNILNI